MKHIILSAAALLLCLSLGAQKYKGGVADKTIAVVGGETILLDSAFGAHDFRDRMGGAYPLSENHYTVLFTAYTPVDQRISIRAARMDRHV